ncbi:cyanophycinase [Peribacillus sp. B-H-3]|uniref:cyanophycinase n=1 Tax=Peribacillus sp. B-H-3 TaxID=3400420 RepID=UPI003B022DE2
MNVGELLIIGGAEEKCSDAEILTKFIELAGGKDGKVGILPTASKIPVEVSEEYIKTFKKLGAEKIEVIHVESREQAEDKMIADLISSMSAVFISGGDQSRLTDLIGGTKLHQSLTDNWRRGMVLAGTSAGASIMAKQMILSADMKLTDNKLKVKLGEGFGFLDTILIDQHFSQRGRFDRLLSAIAQNKDTIGIGIDENTAILIDKEKFEVFGQHQVLVMDGINSDFIDVNISENGSEELTVSQFQVTALTKGFQFDLIKRKLIHQKGIKE